MPFKLKHYPEYKESGLPWLGKIPSHWECIPLSRVATVELSNVDKLSVEGEIPVRLCNYVDVYHRNFITPKINFMEATALPREINKFELRKDDVLITKDSESWSDIAVPAYVLGDLPEVVCGYHLAQIRPNSEILFGAYLFRAFQAEPIAHQFRLAANGVTRYALSRHDIAKGLFTVPSRAEQRVIVVFLAQTDRRINRLIRSKRRLIELLNEQKQAIVHQAVTRGLDPNVRLKPSGIEWLSDVPEHWEVLPFTKCVSERADYRGATPEKVDTGIFLVTAKNVRRGWIDYESSKEYIRVDRYEQVMRRGLPRIGDVLLTTEAPLGQVALVDREDVALAQRIIRFRLDEAKLLPRFALFVMLSQYFQNELLVRATGSTAQGIKASKLPQLLILRPPIEEQNDILNSVSLRTSQCESLLVPLRQIGLDCPS